MQLLPRAWWSVLKDTGFVGLARLSAIKRMHFQWVYTFGVNFVYQHNSKFRACTGTFKNQVCQCTRNWSFLYNIIEHRDSRTGTHWPCYIHCLIQSFGSFDYAPKFVDVRAGLLTTNLATQRTIQENFWQTGELKTCFKSPHYLTLNVTDSLKIPTKGWTMIQAGIEKGERSFNHTVLTVYKLLAWREGGGGIQECQVFNRKTLPCFFFSVISWDKMFIIVIANVTTVIVDLFFNVCFHWSSLPLFLSRWISSICLIHSLL